MFEFFLDWGLESDHKSFISGYFRNECLNVEYHNTLTYSPSPVQIVEFEGHMIRVELKDGDLPDLFYIEPAYGWIVESGENPSYVQENSVATIVLCQTPIT